MSPFKSRYKREIIHKSNGVTIEKEKNGMWVVYKNGNEIEASRNREIAEDLAKKHE